MGLAGLEPTRSKDADFTGRDATNYALYPHILSSGKCWSRTNRVTMTTDLQSVPLPLRYNFPFCSPYGIRTRVSTLKGWCPNQLDEWTILVMIGLEPTPRINRVAYFSIASGL